MDAKVILQRHKLNVNFLLRKINRERGQSFVELALIIPVLLIMLAGVIDIGRFFMCYMELRDAAQEGANYASLMGDEPAGIKDHVQTLSTYPIDLAHDAGVGVTTQENQGGCPSGKYTSVDVIVTYPFQVTAPFVGIFFKNQTIVMTVTATGKVLDATC